MEDCCTSHTLSVYFLIPLPHLPLSLSVFLSPLCCCCSSLFLLLLLPACPSSPVDCREVLSCCKRGIQFGKKEEHFASLSKVSCSMTCWRCTKLCVHTVGGFGFVHFFFPQEKVSFLFNLLRISGCSCFKCPFITYFYCV